MRKISQELLIGFALGLGYIAAMEFIAYVYREGFLNGEAYAIRTRAIKRDNIITFPEKLNVAENEVLHDVEA